MSKYMDYFYIFSKLTTSIVLILIIIILGYSLVNSYQGIDKASIKLNTKIDSLSNLNTNNKKEVISLNNKINNTDAEIKEIKKLLKQITKNTSAIKQQDQIKAILESLTLLQKEFKDFSELNKLKDMKNNTLIVNNSPNELKEQIEQILEFTIIKYGNGENVQTEILLLEELIPNNNKEIFEKLNLISSKNFYGKKNLKKEFDLSLEKYIKFNFIKSNQKPVISFLYKFIKIRPSNLNIYENDELNILMKAKKLMENDSFQESLNLILTIDNKKEFFYKWFQQIQIYIEFINTIKKVA